MALQRCFQFPTILCSFPLMNYSLARHPGHLLAAPLHTVFAFFQKECSRIRAARDLPASDRRAVPRHGAEIEQVR